MISEQNFKDLEEKGYTVVPGVIAPTECDQYIDQYNKWLATFKGKWPESGKGLIRGFTTGHLEPTWNIRLQTKGVFSQIWKTDKLLTSFDSIAIGRPPENGEEPFDNGSSHWLHLDQEACREGLHAYQGGVYLEEACEDDWTLQVMEKSHKYFHQFFSENKGAARKSNEKQFFRLSQTHVRYFEKYGCRIKRIPAPKGGIVLWDSRLVHANAQPIEGRANPGRWRYVTFVSMTPALWASSEDMSVKQRAYGRAQMTNHWSSEGTQLLKESAASRAHPKTGLDMGHSKEKQQLAGMVPYDFEDGTPNGPPKPVTHSSTDR